MTAPLLSLPILTTSLPSLGVSLVADAISRKWSLTREGFDQFLACLDPDREKAGRRYELIRSKLINYFDWRDCPYPEDHADEALNRTIRKIEEGDEIRDPSTYVFGIARMLLLEIGRAKEKERSVLNLLPTAQAVDEESDEAQMRVDCLRLCLERLSEENRQLIFGYYEGDGGEKIVNRKELADRLGLPPTALRVRACRLREKLQACMRERLIKQSEGNEGV